MKFNLFIFFIFFNFVYAAEEGIFSVHHQELQNNNTLPYSYFLDKIATKIENKLKIDHNKYSLAKQTIGDLSFLQKILLKPKEIIDISLWKKYIMPDQINKILLKNEQGNNKRFKKLLISVQKENENKVLLEFHMLLSNFTLNLDNNNLEININSIFDKFKKAGRKDLYIEFDASLG